MFYLLHSIAGNCFSTKSNIACEFMQKNSMARFQLERGHPDISQILTMVSDKDLILPPLSQIALAEICRYNTTMSIYSDTLTISPTLSEATIKKLALSLNFSDHYYPLLNAEFVRSAVIKSLFQPEKVHLQLHKLVVEVFDYERMVFQVFFHSSLAHLLQFDLSFNGIRRLFSAAFPAFKALIVHSSGIIVNGRVALFLAPDEGGKSTAVGLGPPENVLCDDYNVLSHRQGICEAHATPWGNLCNGPVSAPLGGLFFLEKTADFSLSPLKAAEAVARIWAENVRFLKLLPRELKNRAFHTLTDICQKTPAYTMAFAKDYIDWQAIEQAMAR